MLRYIFCYHLLSGLPINDEDDESGDELPSHVGPGFIGKQSNNMEENEGPSMDFPACVLKSKSVFKCRICPRIVCLNEETLMAHLKSKVICWPDHIGLTGV